MKAAAEEGNEEDMGAKEEEPVGLSTEKPATPGGPEYEKLASTKMVIEPPPLPQSPTTCVSWLPVAQEVPSKPAYKTATPPPLSWTLHTSTRPAMLPFPPTPQLQPPLLPAALDDSSITGSVAAGNIGTDKSIDAAAGAGAGAALEGATALAAAVSAAAAVTLAAAAAADLAAEEHGALSELLRETREEVEAARSELYAARRATLEARAGRDAAESERDVAAARAAAVDETARAAQESQVAAVAARDNAMAIFDALTAARDAAATSAATESAGRRAADAALAEERVTPEH